MKRTVHRLCTQIHMGDESRSQAPHPIHCRQRTCQSRKDWGMMPLASDSRSPLRSVFFSSIVSCECKTDVRTVVLWQKIHRSRRCDTLLDQDCKRQLMRRERIKYQNLDIAVTADMHQRR